MGKLRPAVARLRQVPQRLLDALRPSPGCVTLVHASAGYGKTTALAATQGQRSTWYTLDATDADPAVFALRLSRAMGFQPPTQEASTVDAMALELARQLQGPPTTVTLDRWEQVGRAVALGSLLDGLILLAPALALRVATRTRPSLPLERMRLEGRLIDVGPGDLRLEREEISDLLTASWQRPPYAGELDFADTVLVGWPAALQLWLSGLDSAGMLAPLLPGRLLHEYFEEQVMGSLPEDLRDGLRRDWRWLSGAGPLLERASSARRRELANRLVRDRVAVVPCPDGWHAHPLLVAFAVMRGSRMSDAAALERLTAATRPAGPGIAPGPERPLTIRTFGGLSVVLDDVPLPLRAWPESSRRLLELLLCLPGRRVTAEDGARLLWPRHPAKAARNSFNVALHGLRRALEPELTSGARSRYVVREGRRYRLCLERITCDAEEFARLVRDIAAPLDEASAQRLEAAIELHTGDFLASSGERFAAARRDELRALLLTGAAVLARWRGEAGRGETSRGDLAPAG